MVVGETHHFRSCPHFNKYQFEFAKSSTPLMSMTDILVLSQLAAMTCNLLTLTSRLVWSRGSLAGFYSLLTTSFPELVRPAIKPKFVRGVM